MKKFEYFLRRGKDLGFCPIARKDAPCPIKQGVWIVGSDVFLVEKFTLWGTTTWYFEERSW